MDFEHFSFMVRFRADAGDLVSHWNALYSFFSPEEVTGCKLYYRFDDTLQLLPEPYYILTISNMPVGNARKLLQRFKMQFNEQERLTFLSPYPQHNDYRDAPDFNFLGDVENDGSVTGSAEQVGSMRFTGTLSSVRKLKPALVFIPDDYESGKKILRVFKETCPGFYPIVYPEMCEPLRDYYRLALDNRATYYHISDGSKYFRMYDDVIVFGCENKEEAENILSDARKRGFDRFLCVTHAQKMLPEFEDSSVKQISFEDLLITYLKNSNLYVQIEKAELIACPETMETLLKKCNVKLKRVVRI